MAGAAKYTVAALLCVLALAAMAWSAARPGTGGSGAVAGEWVRGAAQDLAVWYRRGPGSDRPDWQAMARDVHGGDAERGAGLMILHGCGACHEIPGVTAARGTVGPALAGFADRAYVGGVLPNEPGGLVRWLVNPPAHSPDTAMPDLGLTEPEARDIAAYLFTLRGR